MEAVQHPQNLEKVERGIEQALRNFADREANGSELREITAGERIDKIGNMSALAIIEACETTAKDIEEAGHHLWKPEMVYRPTQRSGVGQRLPWWTTRTEERFPASNVEFIGQRLARMCAWA